MTDFSLSSAEDVAPEYLHRSAALLSKKWHPAVIRCLAASDGLGYSGLEARLDGVSAKVLTDALTELRDNDIVDRTEINQQPLRVRYTLTERGEALGVVIESLADWGETYLAGEDEAHVVLDRRMPGLSGDAVLDWIRSQRYDCRVLLVTAEEPDLDILELGCDEYLTKPVLRDELRSVVDDIVARAEYVRDVREYLALRSKLALLDAAESESALAAADAYEQSRERLETLEAQLGDVSGEVESALERLPVAERR